MADTYSPKHAPEYDLQSLLEAGCHFGHKVSKWHPKMADFIFGEQDGIHLFDLAKTAEQMQKVYDFVFDLAKEGKTLLIVGTKKQAKDLVKAAATEAGCFYISSRWMGGMLTNWDQISKSIKRMEEIRSGLENNLYKGYTKYERVQLEKELGRLERFFAGLKGMKQRPDCIFVAGAKHDDLVVEEANKENIPVLALADSDTDPRPLEIVVPANDDAVKSIQFVVDQVATAYKAGRAEQK
jgi:small subunit ribosomal protein S2